jgi:hypothetical protein
MPASAGFLLGLLFDPQDRGYMFVRNLGLHSVIIQKIALLQVFILLRGQLSPDATGYFRGAAVDMTHIGLAVTCTVVQQQQMPSRAVYTIHD